MNDPQKPEPGPRPGTRTRRSVWIALAFALFIAYFAYTAIQLERDGIHTLGDAWNERLAPELDRTRDLVTP